jgi:hypothetical protein
MGAPSSRGLIDALAQLRAGDPPSPRNLISSRRSKHIPDRREKHYIRSAAS